MSENEPGQSTRKTEITGILIALGTLGLALAVFVVVDVISRSQPPKASSLGPASVLTVRPAPGAASGSSSPEDQLATIQRRAPAKPDDPLIMSFREHLDALKRMCSDSRERLSDYTVASQKDMAKRGVNKDLLTIIAEVDFRVSKISTAVARDLGPTQMACADQFALYVVQASVPP